MLYKDRPVARGGSRGVRTNPPCSLAKFILNETAAVQLRVRSFNRVVVLLQTAYKPSCSCYKGYIVTYTSPVEAFATESRILSVKIASLDRSVPRLLIA